MAATSATTPVQYYVPYVCISRRSRREKLLENYKAKTVCTNLSLYEMSVSSTPFCTPLSHKPRTEVTVLEIDQQKCFENKMAVFFTPDCIILW